MSELLSQRHDHGVLQLSLNRPAKKNALTLALYQQLTDALTSAEVDDAVNVVLITGEGESFSAGNDIADFVNVASDHQQLSIIIGFLHCLAGFSKPLVAAVQGDAVGIGTTMLLHCDLVIAASNTCCMMPFVKLGLVPEGASTLLLPKMIGHCQAFELLVEGQPFGAERAVQLGIVNQQVEPDQLLSTALERASHLAQLPGEAVQLSKALLKQPELEQIHQVLDNEGTVFAERLSSDEARAAFSAFLNRS